MGHYHCGNKYHSHIYYGDTSINDCHLHRYGGVTSKENYDPCHTHMIEGKTTYNNGHVHHYKIETGPPIPQPKGGHTHCYKCETKCEDGHVHCIEGYTSID